MNRRARAPNGFAVGKTTRKLKPRHPNPTEGWAAGVSPSQAGLALTGGGVKSPIRIGTGAPECVLPYEKANIPKPGCNRGDSAIGSQGGDHRGKIKGQSTSCSTEG